MQQRFGQLAIKDLLRLEGGFAFSLGKARNGSELSCSGTTGPLVGFGAER